jgi:drug/metabolite transporter (DMT)-like permease
MVQQWKVILAFAAIYIIWGSTYLAIIFAIKDIPPMLMSGMRFLLAGIILYGWCLVKKEKQPDLSSLGKNAFCGILMLFGGSGSLAWAEQYISSGLAAIIVTSVPFWFVLLDKRQWSFYFSSKTILPGLLIGFAGVALLIYFGKSSPVSGVSHGKQLAGILVLVAGGISWTAGSLYSKYKPAGTSVTMNTSVQLMMAGIFSSLVSFISGEAKGFSFSQMHADSLMALLYLIFLGSLVTYLCYIWLLQVRPAAQVSSYVYVNPVVAIILGAIIGKESITWLYILSLSIILCGVLLVNLPKYNISKNKQLSVS